MVLIEPETRQTYQRETREYRQEIPARREDAAETDTREISINLNFLGSISNGFKNLFGFFKAKMSGQDISTVGLSADKKAEYYLKRCWNHMSMNNVEKAREAYDNLVESYEAMEDSQVKANLYYEVYDIYQRLAEVK